MQKATVFHESSMTLGYMNLELLGLINSLGSIIRLAGVGLSSASLNSINFRETGVGVRWISHNRPLISAFSAVIQPPPMWLGEGNPIKIPNTQESSTAGSLETNTPRSQFACFYLTSIRTACVICPVSCWFSFYVFCWSSQIRCIWKGIMLQSQE